MLKRKEKKRKGGQASYKVNLTPLGCIIWDVITAMTVFGMLLK